jgi:TM2 domain-containing membrane protein YozV
MYCRECGNAMSANAAICVKCGVPSGTGSIPGISLPKNRVTFVLLGLFLGGLGIHNFYAGYTTKAVIQLLLSLFTWWLIFPLVIVWIWVIVEICTVTEDAQSIPFS